LYVDTLGGLDQLGQDTLENYFDYADFGRDLAYDYVEYDGHYFNNYYKKGGVTKSRRYDNGGGVDLEYRDYFELLDVNITKNRGSERDSFNIDFDFMFNDVEYRVTYVFDDYDLYEDWRDGKVADFQLLDRFGGEERLIKKLEEQNRYNEDEDDYNDDDDDYKKGGTTKSRYDNGGGVKGLNPSRLKKMMHQKIGNIDFYYNKSKSAYGGTTKEVYFKNGFRPSFAVIMESDPQKVNERLKSWSKAQGNNFNDIEAVVFKDGGVTKSMYSGGGMTKIERYDSNLDDDLYDAIMSMSDSAIERLADNEYIDFDDADELREMMPIEFSNLSDVRKKSILDKINQGYYRG
jgi:hypothetical protein